MKHVPINEIAETATVLPVKLSKKEKLVRWANLIRCSHARLVLFHNLEHYSYHELRAVPIHTCGPNAFEIATRDNVFRTAGLKHDANLVEVIGFFELTQNEVHEFSCDCGGAIDKTEMAERIEGIANGKSGYNPPRPRGVFGFRRY